MEDIKIESSVHCGFPSPAADSAESPLDFNKYLIKHRAATFCLRAKGDSMSPFIESGDVLVVEKGIPPEPNGVIIAAIDGEFVVKRLVKEDGEYKLLSDNPSYPPLEVRDTLSVFGVVTAIVRRIRCVL